jgi:hypothetical protein
MAHFARIDENNQVTEIHVINNSVLDSDGEFPESEASGQAFQASLGFDGDWLQCSYHGNFRGVYPGIGYTYDPVEDVFFAPEPAEVADEVPNDTV